MMKQKLSYTLATMLIVILAVSLVFAINSKGKLEKKYKNAVENVKAYSDQFNSSYDENRAFRLTIDQLKYSKDSIFNELDNVRKELKVKDSKLRSLQYISSDFIKSDTIVLTDTLFKNPSINIDTLLSDEWYSMRVGLRYPSTVTVNPEFKSKKYIVVSAKKETVNPPKKFFLLRWFQRKHTVLNIDVIEKNPYMQNQNSRFVEIVR